MGYLMVSECPGPASLDLFLGVVVGEIRAELKKNDDIKQIKLFIKMNLTQKPTFVIKFYIMNLIYRPNCLMI